jgi:hypothetical protein
LQEEDISALKDQVAEAKADLAAEKLVGSCCSHFLSATYPFILF